VATPVPLDTIDRTACRTRALRRPALWTLGLAILCACTEAPRPAPPHGPVVAAGAAALAADAPDTVPTPPNLADWIRARHPGLHLEMRGSASGQGSRYGSTFYELAKDDESDEYASGVVLWTGGGTPIADLRLNGESPPHTVRWLDFDGDGRRDLLVLWGDEDEEGTSIFLDRAGSHARDQAFVAAYENRGQYAGVLDLDGDGRPEIVQPDAWRGGETEEWPCADMEPPADVRAQAAQEYRRLTRGVRDANFTYGEEGGYEPTVMALWMPVRILAVRGARAVDVTREHAGHVRWRVGLLQRMRGAPGVTKECAAELDRVANVMRERAGLPASP
jgi:hypothetical protein